MGIQCPPFSWALPCLALLLSSAPLSSLPKVLCYPSSFDTPDCTEIWGNDPSSPCNPLSSSFSSISDSYSTPFSHSPYSTSSSSFSSYVPDEDSTFLSTSNGRRRSPDMSSLSSISTNPRFTMGNS
eukprot:GHVT01005951.1.p1 GENE.GHVT01005951.1~~GHVT01005951.1.p1  ORF type:complete len:126 (+),score=9.90 GHVT01005951.1:32-409(+)